MALITSGLRVPSQVTVLMIVLIVVAGVNTDAGKKIISDAVRGESEEKRGKERRRGVEKG